MFRLSGAHIYIYIVHDMKYHMNKLNENTTKMQTKMIYSHRDL